MACAEVGLAPLGAIIGLVSGIVAGTGARPPISLRRGAVVAFAALVLGAAAMAGLGALAPETPCNDTGGTPDELPPGHARDTGLALGAGIIAAVLAGPILILFRMPWNIRTGTILAAVPVVVAAAIIADSDPPTVPWLVMLGLWVLVAGGVALGPRERLKSNGPLGTDVTQKARYRDPTERRLYPISTFNSWCARPISRVLAPVLSPNQVSLASLLVSVAGLALVWTAQWQEMIIGAGLVHVGLLLDHADGQVARRTGTGSTWGMYLDMVIDRIVEVGLVIALWPALTNGVTGAPGPWITLTPGWAAPLAMATIATILLWRFLSAYNDVLYLRAHLTETARMPHPSARPQGLVRRPLVPWVFNRDWLLLFWALLVALGQPQAALGILLATTLLMCIERIIVFRTRHKTPEGDANRILGQDYH